MLQSMLLILLFGLLSNKLFTKLKLPGLLGMILAGVLLGPYGLNLLEGPILENSTEIRLIALIIILLRAGLGLNKDTLKKVGKAALKMSAIPCIVEGLTLIVAAHYLIDLSILEAGMLAFIIAAVSPAVVVPSMLALKEKGLGTKKGVPVLILAGASVDDIFAITLFTAFLGMGATTTASKSLWAQGVQIPVEILGGILLGGLLGILLSTLYNSKRFQFAPLEKISLLLVGAFFAQILGTKFHISGLLAVMTIGFVLLEKNPKEAISLEQGLNKIWFFAQTFLFILIGAAVNLPVAMQGGAVGILVIAIGLIGRTLGVMISLYGSSFNRKERLFCAIAYTPKATVQAAIGGIPLAAGVPSGELILAISVLAIIFTAPLGAIGIKISAPRLLEEEAKELVS